MSRQWLRIGVVVAACGGSALAQSGGTPTIQSVRERVARDVPASMKYERVPGLPMVPGLAIAVIDGGAVVFSRGFGVTRAKDGVAVTDETRFEAASLSKPVTAYVALQLVDAGTLALDAPLTRYVKYADLPDDARAAAITARIVLSHRTGFANWRRRDPLQIFFTPGERFSYSGEGYVYLQRAIESITAETLDVAADRLVFKPLGMTRTSFVPASGAPDVAWPHTDIGTPLPVPPQATRQVNAAASLVTTAADYGRFVAAALGGDRLKRETAYDMFTPQIHLDPTCTQCTGRSPKSLSKDLSWGLGWGIEESSAGRTIWHWGDNPGFKNYVAVSLTSRRGFVYFSNSDSGLALRDRITEMVIGGQHPASALLTYPQLGADGLKPR
jgi:CubicO group peptidase (beta-lactamase class C family)